MRPVWYCDGACSGNGMKHSHGGFGVVCVDADTETILYQHQEFHEPTTNNRMEMSAIIHSLRQAYKLDLYGPGGPIIYSDSSYAVNTFSSWMFSWAKKGWKKSDNQTPENLDLVQEFYNLQQDGYQAQLIYVRGHAGHKWNEYVDGLATKRIQIPNSDQ